MIILFEQYENYRDVNLIQFFRDFEKYENQLKGSIMLHIKNMLMGKKIEFHDDVMRYKTSGTVNEINHNFTKHNKFLSIYFVEDKNTHTFSLNFNPFLSKNFQILIKIYNSKKTSIEEQIDMIKDSEKYNL